MPDFTSFDGTRLAYYEWPGSSAVRPVVLLHGFIAHSIVNWEGPGVIEALTQAGRRVIALDSRGHGASEKPHDPARYGEATMAQDVCALLDVIGAPEVDLVGYSMGGVVALVTALRDARVARLLVGGIGAGVVEVGGLDNRVVPPGLLAEALLAEEPADPTTQPGAFRAFADLLGSDRRALAAAISGEHPGHIPVGQLAVPTMLIAGADDPLAVRPHVLTDAIPGAKLVVLPGDHLSVLRDPGFLPALTEFLAS